VVLLLSLLAVFGVAACSDDDSSSEDATTSAAESDGDTDSDGGDDSVPDEAGEDEEDEDESGAATAGALELPDGAVMAARLTVESGEYEGTSEFLSTSDNACSVGLFLEDEYSVSYSTLVLEGEQPDGETTSGGEVYSFGLDVTIDGGGSGEAEGEAGAVLDENSAYNNIEDQDAEIVVEEEGDGLRITFEGMDEETDVPFDGEVVCASVNSF